LYVLLKRKKNEFPLVWCIAFPKSLWFGKSCLIINDLSLIFVSHISLLFKFVFVTEMNEKYKLGLLDKWQIYFSKYIFFLLLYFQLRSVCMLTIVHSKLSTTTSFSYYSCKLSFFVFWTFNCDKNWNKWQV
jgi:hypothetical protein